MSRELVQSLCPAAFKDTKGREQYTCCMPSVGVTILGDFPSESTMSKKVGALRARVTEANRALPSPALPACVMGLIGSGSPLPVCP